MLAPSEKADKKLARITNFEKIAATVRAEWASKCEQICDIDEPTAETSSASNILKIVKQGEHLSPATVDLHQDQRLSSAADLREQSSMTPSLEELSKELVEEEGKAKVKRKSHLRGCFKSRALTTSDLWNSDA